MLFFLGLKNTQSCTCGGAPPKKFCQGLLTAPLWYYLLFTRAKKYATISSLTREALAMELSIIIAIFTTAAVGFCGGIIFAHIFELPAEREARLRAKRRRDRRNARHEKNRKNVNFTIDKF